MKKALPAVCLLLCVALLAGCGIKDPASGVAPGTVVKPGKVEYNGDTYRLHQDQTVILVMGLDKYEHPEDYDGYINDMQSDFMALLILDKTARRYDVLHLNRDTMTKIRRLGVGGGGAGSFTGQLALAHTYGSGGSDSCLNATKAVSELLHGIRIDHYITLTMDAVTTVNDSVGGVTLELMDDFTAMDPRMEQGKTLTLTGEQALLYVRGRMNLSDSSNLHRMERQRQYASELYRQVMAQQESDENFLLDLLLSISDSIVSDCTVNQLDALADQIRSYTEGQIYTLPGEAVKGEQFIEFYPDPDKTRELTMALFYEKEN